MFLLLLGRVAVCTAIAAYSHRPFLRTICWSVCLTVGLSVQWTVEKRLNGSGCHLEW